jgi:insertion element IS1 protein InsB
VAFCSKKTEKLWIWKATYIDSKGKTRLLNLVTGNRDTRTFERLLRKVDPAGTAEVFLTDDYNVYAKVLPAEKHLVGKDLTYTIEQHNSDTRHYGARFKRKSKVVSKKADRVEMQIKMTEWATKQGGLEMLAPLYLSN